MVRDRSWAGSGCASQEYRQFRLGDSWVVARQYHSLQLPGFDPRPNRVDMDPTYLGYLIQPEQGFIRQGNVKRRRLLGGLSIL